MLETLDDELDEFMEKCGMTKIPRRCACERAQNEAHEAAIEDDARDIKIQQFLSKANVPGRYKGATLENLTLEHMDQEQSRQLTQAVNLCRGFIENPGSKVMILTGTVGTGKTHMAAAMLQGVIRKHVASGLWWNQISMSGRLHRLWSANSGDTAARIVSYALGVRVLVLDELGSSPTKANQIERAYELVDTRMNNGLPIIMTTNANRRELERNLDERIVDRLFDERHSLVLNLRGLSYRRVG